ncbi:IS3 family transposase [Providencia rettgeri]|nr:IS3 family transposase [Providencia rettgeri]UPS61183.1 IS3 family transposase [Providencia rettgeri]UPS62077.1 IS3 family transposase [Providencia rettgeri]UPS63984.1 IS3 family transposase [Providencia rettgeri]
MKAITKRTQRDYSLAFKLQVVDQVEKGELTYKQAQYQYGIQGCSTVLVWLRKHGRLDWSEGTPNTLYKGTAMTQTPEQQTPEQRIKLLERELEEARLKSDFFEAVVKVMDRDFGVRLSKKRKAELLKKKPVKNLTVTIACRFMNISRQAYYKRQDKTEERQKIDTAIIDIVKSERAFHPRLGGRKLHFILKQKQMIIGRDRLFTLLKEHRLLVPNKRAYHRTTLSHHRFHRHPNLIKSGFIPTQPEQLWVADITYLSTHEGDTYLSLITDAYSRKIVGYHLDDNMKTSSVKKSLVQALKKRCSTTSLIHHSDRGLQYCSSEYQEIHRNHNIQCSMTDGYDCYQNALAERINGILKMEYLLVKPRNLEQARRLVEESIQIYNERRPHLSLNYKTPDEVHRAFYA